MTKIYRLIRYDWPMHFILWITNVFPDNVFFIRVRGALVKPFFKKCGKKLGVGRNVVFYNPSKMEIGDYVYVAYGCWFSSGFGVKIEDEVLFGPYNVIATSNHTKLDGSYRFGEPSGGPIHFKKGSWVGANCTILANTTIGEGTVIAANSVAKGEIPNHVVVAGNPGIVKNNSEK